MKGARGETVSERAKPSSKKTYQVPSLRVYGDIRVLTQAVGMMGHGDGGMAPAAMTN
jgi:hypothetical protein